jgi:hypothetical protein
VGKTQIQDILKNKEALRKDYEDGAPPEKKRNLRKTGNEEINSLIYEWFRIARSKNMPITGPLLQEKARIFAERLDSETFKASNGWLESFRKRHGIKFSVLSGEAADVSDETVADWTQRLPHLCKEYEPENIFNVDESGVFYRTLPDKSFTLKGEQCKGGKKAKERITVMLCCSLTGEKLKPLVIGKAEKPRCFKGLDISQLPVTWRSNRKAWMTRALFEDWLRKLDNQMVLKKRKIVLFLDNAPCHPDIQLRDVKLQFFPINTTSRLQPLDQGIIKNMKVHYKKRLLRHVLAHMDVVSLAQEVIKSVTVLHAANWIAQAWKEVTPQTIMNCFGKGGFTTSSNEEDDSMSPLEDMQHLLQSSDLCSAEDLLTFDDDLETSETLDDEWEQELLDRTMGIGCTEPDENDTEETEEELSIHHSSIFSHKEAIECIDCLQDYAIHNNSMQLTELLMQVQTIVHRQLSDSKKGAKQTTLDSSPLFLNSLALKFSTLALVTLFDTLCSVRMHYVYAIL